jgi:hypothetical protein
MKMNFELPDQNDENVNLVISHETEAENVTFAIKHIDDDREEGEILHVEILLDDLVRIVKQLKHDSYYAEYVNNKKKNSST